MVYYVDDGNIVDFKAAKGSGQSSIHILFNWLPPDVCVKLVICRASSKLFRLITRDPSGLDDSMGHG